MIAAIKIHKYKFLLSFLLSVGARVERSLCISESEPSLQLLRCVQQPVRLLFGEEQVVYQQDFHCRQLPAAAAVRLKRNNEAAAGRQTKTMS